MVRQPACSGAAALLERGGELARIDELIAASVEGEGHVLVIEGRSGVGKSALLGELRSRAGEAGMAVCSARGSELEGELAFGVVRQLFEATVRAGGEAEPGSGLFQGAAALAAPVLGSPARRRAEGSSPRCTVCTGWRQTWAGALPSCSRWTTPTGRTCPRSAG